MVDVTDQVIIAWNEPGFHDIIPRVQQQSARVSKNAKFRSQARMLLTSGYVLIVCVLVKSDFLYTFERDFSSKGWTFFKVARNEVENASFAQRSAHRDSRIWRPELIEPAAERKRRARADDDRRSNWPTPTHRFCHSAIFCPITPYNVRFFWVSRHRSVILAKKMETFSGRFWEIPGNVLKLELLKMLIDHKNTSVFFQAVSGMSSWSFSFRWTQYQWEKKSY